MTTTDTPPAPLEFWAPGFDHTTARRKAVGVLTEVAESIAESIGQTGWTGISIDHRYSVQVQFQPEQMSTAIELAHRWSAGDPVVEATNEHDHHNWSFVLNETPVKITCLTDR